MNLNTLPTREEYQRAIGQLWRGGGTASLIIDVARQAGASITEAQELAQRLSASLANGLHFISRDIAEQELEAVLALGERRKSQSVRANNLSPRMDWSKCAFSSVLDCPQCSALEGAPRRHGTPMPTGDWARVREGT